MESGIISVWTKCYRHGGMIKRTNYRSLAEARRDYHDDIKDSDVSFAQFGAWTTEGPIVLGEYRPVSR